MPVREVERDLRARSEPAEITTLKVVALESSKDWENIPPFFQALENLAGNFPRLGKFTRYFSKAWKIVLVVLVLVLDFQAS